MKTEAEITHNAKVKLYPDGTAKLIVASSPIFRAAGWEPTATQRSNAGERCEQPDERARTDSVRRSRQKVFDLAALNEWELFVTLTLDKERIDRYDPSAVAGRVKKWLDNGVQRHGWRYLLIPELHRDGAVHMHGLFSGGLRLVDSGHKTARGQTIYNLPQWRYGFTTAMEVYGGVQGVSRYITKYITKDMRLIFGNRYYAGGRALVRKPPEMLLDLDFRAVPSACHYVKEAGVSFKYFDLVLEGGKLPETVEEWRG